MPSPAANKEMNDNNFPPLAAEDTPSETTRSGRKPKYSACYLRYIKSLGTVAKSKKNSKTNMSVPVEPASYEEAILCDDSQLWIEGIVDKFDSLIENGTWEYVDLPPGRKAIERKWVFKLKPRNKSTPPRYKARFVINGFSQVFGVDYNETSDPCPFIRHQRKGDTEVSLAFLLYVNDGLIVSNSTAAMTEMVDFLSKEFDIKTLPADRFIGIDTTEEQQEMSRTPYLEAIGSLLHLSNLTRCDIAFAVGQASRYSNNPGKAHWRAVKRIIAYLKQTIHFGIAFGESDGECHQLFGYCDSD